MKKIFKNLFIYLLILMGNYQLTFTSIKTQSFSVNDQNSNQLSACLEEQYYDIHHKNKYYLINFPSLFNDEDKKILEAYNQIVLFEKEIIEQENLIILAQDLKQISNGNNIFFFNKIRKEICQNKIKLEELMQKAFLKESLLLHRIQNLVSKLQK